MKSRLLIATAVGTFLLSAGYTIVRADDDDGNGMRIRIGLAYAHDQGIKLTFKGRDRELVGLGSYLVNDVGGCNECHTPPPFTKDPEALLGAQKQSNVG